MIWLRPAALAMFATAVLVSCAAAIQRNRAYLGLLHGRSGIVAANSGSGHQADQVLALRLALGRGDWPAVSRLLTETTGLDRLAPLLVLREVDARLARQDREGARAALATIRPDAGIDCTVWYLVGQKYERLGLPQEAVRAYGRGNATDPDAPWSEGQYLLAMVAYRQQQWKVTADLLGPLLASAAGADLTRPVQRHRTGGPAWQGVFLMLGDAAEHLGRTSVAEDAYARICANPQARRDWTLNRALVGLARIDEARSDLAASMDLLARALDVATEYPESFRAEYESATAAAAGDLVDHARRAGNLPALGASGLALVQRSPQSPGARYLLGLVLERQCDAGGASDEYARSRRLVRPGAGSFLAGRPSVPSAPCAR